MHILAINPGGNSLKAQLVRCAGRQRYAFEGQKLCSITIEDIGKEPVLFGTIHHPQRDREIERSSVQADSYAHAVQAFLKWYRQAIETDQLPSLDTVEALGIRVVHGGEHFAAPALFTHDVIRKVESLESLAPLHNKSSLEVLEPLRAAFQEKPIFAVFDTAFHRTMPEHAWRYGLPYDLANRLGLRRYGFHGISHRYQLERYAWLQQKPPQACNLVTTHLESGCSVTAICQGQSIDNSMGLTPLEGLMMGTRCGEIDPSVLDVLTREEHLSLDESLKLLNKQSGLLGLSGISLDTRVLMKQYETSARTRIAMDTFVYRLRKAIGAFVAAVSAPEAIVFSGGIGEDTPFVRAGVAEGLRACGVSLDPAANESAINIEGRISTPDSKVAAWVIITEEGLQIAHECFQAQQAR